MSTDIAKKKNCDYNNYKRTRYFHGMLLTERDFQEEQIYHQEKRRLLNRKLHGWGVVCGLGVKATAPESSKIIITSGMAIDCLGNEIVVCDDFEIDLKKLPDLCPGTPGVSQDPCIEKEGPDCRYYIGIKYTEAPTDPVAVYSPGGSCEEKTCEYSRVREGYCVDFFKCPPCHARPLQDGFIEKIVACFDPEKNREDQIKCAKDTLVHFHATFCQEPYPCPVCCCEGDPYVILGSLELLDKQTKKCTVTAVTQDMIDINDERRYVLTPMFWQYYFGSFFSPISVFLDNPFNLICESLKGRDISPQATTVTQMTSVRGMTQEEARKAIADQKLVYNATVRYSPGTAFSLATRSFAAFAGAKLVKGAKVDLIINSRDDVLFYVPAEAAPETADVQAIRKDFDLALNKMDAKYKQEIAKLQGEIDKLKK